MKHPHSCVMVPPPSSPKANGRWAYYDLIAWFGREAVWDNLRDILQIFRLSRNDAAAAVPSSPSYLVIVSYRIQFPGGNAELPSQSKTFSFSSPLLQGICFPN